VSNVIPNRPTSEFEYAGVCKAYSAPGQSAVWSDGQFLYAPHRAIFPERCVLCNKSHNVRMNVVKLRSTPQFAAIPFAVLGGFVGGFFAQVLFQRSITVQIGTCRSCNNVAALHLIFSALLSVATIALFLAAHILHDKSLILPGLGTLIFALLFFILFPRPARVVEINGEVARLDNVSQAFLDSLA
jgi:hypothetical protein